MACLSFGRPTLRGASQASSAAAAEDGSTASWALADHDCATHTLAVPEDPARTCAEGAVFEAVAQQATAFICNLDEATVNCGAAELGGSAGGPCGAFAGDATPPGSCSGSSSPSGGARSPSAGGDSGRASCGWSSGTWGGAALFRRLSAAKADSGFGWRERRAAFEAAMERENRVERLVARSDAAASEKRLQHRLMVARLEPVAFRGCSGGNSLFDALSLALWGTTAHGRCLRALAVAHAAEHPAEYRCFLGDDWAAYLGGMTRPGTPGDELMLRAVADHFGLPINIVTSDAFMWFQRYAPVKTHSRREVTLAFLGPCTWMPVRRQSAMTTLRLSLSGGSEWRQAREMRRKMMHMDLQQQQQQPPGTPR